MSLCGSTDFVRQLSVWTLLAHSCNIASRYPYTCSLVDAPGPALLRDEQALSPIYHCAFGFAPVRCLRRTDEQFVDSA